MSSSRTSSVDIGTIQDDESLSDGELLARMHEIEEEHQELEQQREREELKRDPDLRIKQYRAAHFICHPRCGFVVDRRDEGAIIEHKSRCGYCIEASAEREKEIELKREGYSKMGYVLGMIEKCKNDVEIQKRKIVREKREKLDNYEFVVKVAETKIGEIQNRLKREQIEKHKLLNDPNETVCNAVRELYERYLQASESARRRDQY